MSERKRVRELAIKAFLLIMQIMALTEEPEKERPKMVLIRGGKPEEREDTPGRSSE